VSDPHHPTGRPARPRQLSAAAWCVACLWSALGAAGAIAPETPPGWVAALPGDCDFYATADLARQPAARETLLRMFPAVAPVLQRARNAGLLPAGARLDGLGLTGMRRDDDVFLGVWLQGDFQEASILKALGNRAAPVSPSPGVAFFQLREPGAEPPLCFCFPRRDLLVAGKAETLAALRQSHRLDTPPPALLTGTGGTGALTLYLGERLMAHLLSAGSGGSSYAALQRLFAGITELAWNLEPAGRGACVVQLTCRRGEDAAGIALLLKHFVSLALVAAGRSPTDAETILASFSVAARGSSLRATFDIPPALLDRLFQPAGP